MRSTLALFSKGAQFRSQKLDIGSHINVRVLRDHTKRKVFAENEPLRYVSARGYEARRPDRRSMLKRWLT